jgi:hypothetical protein
MLVISRLLWKLVPMQIMQISKLSMPRLFNTLSLVQSPILALTT